MQNKSFNILLKKYYIESVEPVNLKGLYSILIGKEI